MNYDRNGALLESHIPELDPPKRGKVRDIYDLGDSLLLVASDRLSAFDVVMPNGIPDKGRVLTGLSSFWFSLLDWMPNHVISADADAFPEVLQPYADDLRGREALPGRNRTRPRSRAHNHQTRRGQPRVRRPDRGTGEPARCGHCLRSQQHGSGTVR